MPGGNLDTGNPMGKNSVIYGSYQGDDFTPGGGGARIPFLKHLPNALSYLKKGLRDVTDAMEQYNNLSSGFGNKTKINLNSIDKGSVFQNEIVKHREEYLHHLNLPYGNQRDTTPQFGWTDYYSKRKDSAKTVIMIRKKMDSIKNRFNK